MLLIITNNNLLKYITFCFRMRKTKVNFKPLELKTFEKVLTGLSFFSLICCRMLFTYYYNVYKFLYYLIRNIIFSRCLCTKKSEHENKTITLLYRDKNY